MYWVQSSDTTGDQPADRDNFNPIDKQFSCSEERTREALLIEFFVFRYVFSNDHRCACKGSKCSNIQTDKKNCRRNSRSAAFIYFFHDPLHDLMDDNAKGGLTQFWELFTMLRLVPLNKSLTMIVTSFLCSKCKRT